MPEFYYIFAKIDLDTFALKRFLKLFMLLM